MDKHDGWALKMPNGQIHAEIYRQKKKDLIERIEWLCPGWLKTLEKRGFKAVKVKLVEVE